MRKTLRDKLTYANVMSSIAVFLVLGGATAFAAGQLAKHSVGTKQIKNGAITGPKIKKASIEATKLTELAISTLRGQKGARGATGAKGSTGAKGERGAIGPQGTTGATGPEGQFPATLPAGKSLSGYMTIFGSGTTIASNSAAFLYPLASNPAAHFIKSGAATPAGCTGNSLTPGASPGNLCIFVLSEENLETAGEDGPAGNGSTDTRGFAAFATGAAAGKFGLKLRWIVTG